MLHIKRINESLLKDDYRMYFVSYENPFWETFNGHASDVSDEQFVALAEEEGQVYTLEGFQDAFNMEDSPLESNNALRILPTNYVRGLK